MGENYGPEYLISSYRQRRKVEEAFSYLKGFIEIRPFYHHKEERVKAHILICILGYLLEVTIEYLLKGKEERMTFREFYQKAKKVRAIEVEVEDVRKGLKMNEVPREIVKILEKINMKEIGEEKFLQSMT